jgi:hypothetical protein
VTARITIVCNDPSHEGKTSIVTRYARSGSGWVPERHIRRDKAGRAGRMKPSAGTQLAGDTPIAESSVGEIQAKPLRDQDRIECDLCGLNASRRRENLAPDLDAAERAGLPTIELADLVRRLS